MYTVDNGANAGWGDIPIGNGSGGTCTNGTKEPGVSDPDTLHLITGAGYYGGHPNPTRGNRANTFDNPAQSPVPTANPVECNYLKPGTSANPDLTTFNGSTNGIAEYTASNFDGVLNGHLLLANYNGSVVDVKVDSSWGGALQPDAALERLDSPALLGHARRHRRVPGRDLRRRQRNRLRHCLRAHRLRRRRQHLHGALRLRRMTTATATPPPTRSPTTRTLARRAACRAIGTATVRRT